jgi:hypothetical protein
MILYLFLYFLIYITFSKECTQLNENDYDFEWMCPDEMFCGDLHECCIFHNEPGNGKIETEKICEFYD